MKTILCAATASLFLSGAAFADHHSSPEAVISGIYDAFAAGDPEGFAAALHPDIVWNEAESNVYADMNPYQGPQAVMEGVIGRVLTDWSTFNATPEEMIVEGNRFVVLGRYTGTHGTTGEDINAQMVHVWTVEDGQAISFQQYVDTLQLREAETPDE